MGWCFAGDSWKEEFHVSGFKRNVEKICRRCT